MNNLRLAFLVCLTLSAANLSARAELVTALTNDNSLVNFDTATPGTTSTVTITGLMGGDFLSDIDERPATGQLYGLANTAGTGRLYSIDRFTGEATLQSTVSTALTGSFFGVDFNPVVDRLRIVSDQGQNLRIDVSTGAATLDGTLQFAAGDANAGTPPQVVASAYSNNFAGTASTTLYGLDLSTQSLVTQSPPNAGTLNTIGSLSNILFAEAGFDISGISGLAYAVLNGFELVQVNLATGVTTSLGAINAPSSIVGFAAQSGITAVPEPSSALLVLAAAALFFRVRQRRSNKESAVGKEKIQP